MANHKLELTSNQLLALLSVVDEFEAGLGSGENDGPRIKWVKDVDAMLDKTDLKDHENR